MKLKKETTYEAIVKCENILEAMVNGLTEVFPKTEMKYDGKWCKFYKGKKEVWDCNPQFAIANFTLIAKK